MLALESIGKNMERVFGASRGMGLFFAEGSSSNVRKHWTSKLKSQKTLGIGGKSRKTDRIAENPRRKMRPWGGAAPGLPVPPALGRAAAGAARAHRRDPRPLLILLFVLLLLFI